MIIKLKKAYQYISEAVVAWWQHDPFTQSAAVAYYTIFSFPALMILYFATASLFIAQGDLQTQTFQFLAEKFGADSAKQLETIITNTAPSHTNIGAFFLAGGILLYAALRVFSQLQKALNYIWGVDDTKVGGIKIILLRRAVSFSVMLGVVFTLVVSLLMTSFISIFTEWLMERLPAYIAFLFHGINFTISFITITLLFTLLLKNLPDTPVRWCNALAGAALSALLFVAGEYALGIYFSITEPSSAYGVTGSLILLMLWVSYTCTILLLGAELSRVMASSKIAH